MTDDRSGQNNGAAATERALEATMREIGIPPRPAIIDRIGREMHKPEPDFRHLAELISADVALAAGLLKVVNSPYFGYEGRARTVVQALMMLGLDVASRAVAGLALRKVFPPLPAFERFWDGSARVARTSGWLVGRLGMRGSIRADDAYTYGLFRDCGIPILIRKFPGYIGILRAANNEAELSFTVIEHGGVPTDHALVGSMMARDWWLPEEVSNAIRYHHEAVALLSGPHGVSGDSARLVALSQLAEHLVQRISGLSTTHEWEKLGGICRDLLAIDAVAVEALVEEAVPVVADVIN